jgi:small subunit ribosomal protein S2
MLTNWPTIQTRIDRLNQLDKMIEDGTMDKLPKKESARLQEERTKLDLVLGGIRTMNGLPSTIFIIDCKKEHIAIKEAHRLEIPIVAVVDTNCDPDEVDYVIPGNDDAIRAVKLIVSVIADAAEEGQRIREVQMSDTGQVSQSELAEMERYLGPSTLAKLKGKDEDEELDEDTYEEYSEYEEEDDADKGGPAEFDDEDEE